MTCPRGCCPDYRTHIQGINIGSFPTSTTYTERRWDKDMPAYKRLVEDGLQPPRIDGSAAIERNARNEIEVERGHAIDNETLAVMDDAGI